jgi:hypothetical protein
MVLTYGVKLALKGQARPARTYQGTVNALVTATGLTTFLAAYGRSGNRPIGVRARRSVVPQPRRLLPGEVPQVSTFCGLYVVARSWTRVAVLPIST